MQIPGGRGTPGFDAKADAKSKAPRRRNAFEDTLYIEYGKHLLVCPARN
jgi:hypothetical protein